MSQVVNYSTKSIVIKKFTLQNLSFLPKLNSNFFQKTIIFETNSVKKNTLVPYINLLFFYIQNYSCDSLDSIKLHYFTNDNFFLKNLKLFTPKISPKNMVLYACGDVNSAPIAAKSFGLFNKFFRYFSNYSDVFFFSWMANIFFIGVGYKVFIFNNYLYLRLGFSRMLKIMIPSGIVVMTRKRNHLRIISSSHEQLESFLYLLKNLRVFDCYKGKGIFQNSDFSTVKLKVGKKQQFF